MINSEKLILGALALAGAIFHPAGYAQAKEAPIVWSKINPIGTFIGAKMGWDTPAAKRVAPKPKVVATQLSSDAPEAPDIAASLAAKVAAEAARLM